jgi:hypothetical protein
MIRTAAARLSTIVFALLACAQVPAIVDDRDEGQPPGASASLDLPTSPVWAVGEASERATVVVALAGIWGFAGEVWQIDGERAQVYLPRDHDIIVELEIEVIAPCMFVAHQGDALLGPFVVDHRGRETSWTRDGTASFRLRQRDTYAVCRGSEVFLLGDETCEAWRFDLDSGSFDAGPAPRSDRRGRRVAHRRAQVRPPTDRRLAVQRDPSRSSDRARRVQELFSRLPAPGHGRCRVSARAGRDAHRRCPVGGRRAGPTGRIVHGRTATHQAPPIAARDASRRSPRGAEGLAARAGPAGLRSMPG